MAKTDGFIPIWIGPYLSNTKHLSTLKHGAYFLTLMHCWVKGPLVNDLEQITQVMGLFGDDATSIARSLLNDFFSMGSDGFWHQKRLELEKAKAVELASIYRERGIKAAKARWINHIPKRKTVDATSMSQAIPEDCPRPGSTKSKSLPSLRSGNPKSLQGTASASVKGQVGKPTSTPPATPRINRGRGSPNYLESVSNGQNGNGTNGHGLTKEKRTNESDPRSVVFMQEVQEFWKGQNPKGPDCPWGIAERKALNNFLEASPDIKISAFRTMLKHRAGSAVNPAALPRTWLGKLQAFAHGPLNKFGDPL